MKINSGVKKVVIKENNIEEESFKSNAHIKGALRQHSLPKHHIQIGEELYSKKTPWQNPVTWLVVASVAHKWARSSVRQSTWLLKCMEFVHAWEDTRWSGVQIPSSPFFTPHRG